MREQGGDETLQNEQVTSCLRVKPVFGPRRVDELEQSFRRGRRAFLVLPLQIRRSADRRALPMLPWTWH